MPPVNQPRFGQADPQPIRSNRAEGLSFSQYHAAVQQMGMTLASFIETKFIPEHVAFKTRAGQTYYMAILKHLITPEVVKEIFPSGPIATTRMRAVPEWPYLDEVRLSELTESHVRSLIHAATEAGYSRQTVVHIKSVLFAIISHAQKEGWFLGPNPAGLVRLSKSPSQIEQSLTYQETKAILELLQYPAKAIAIFTITTGMALKEICDLEWKYVNLGSTVRYADGEPMPPLSLAVKTPSDRAPLGAGRSAIRNRTIEIREPLLSTLRELSRLHAHSNPVPRYVIAHDNENVPIFRSCTNELKRVGESLGIPWLTWQALRRARTSITDEFLVHLNPSWISGDPGISEGMRDSFERSATYRYGTTPPGVLAGFRRRLGDAAKSA